jgi:hypothetical protein
LWAVPTFQVFKCKHGHPPLDAAPNSYPYMTM